MSIGSFANCDIHYKDPKSYTLMQTKEQFPQFPWEKLCQDLHDQWTANDLDHAQIQLLQEGFLQTRSLKLIVHQNRMFLGL